MAIIEKEDSSRLTMSELGVWAYEEFKHKGIWKPVPKSTIDGILSQRSRKRLMASAPYQRSHKHLGTPIAPRLEEKLARELERVEKGAKPVKQTMIQELAKAYAMEDPRIAPQMKFSRGWVQSALKRKQAIE